MGTKERLKQFIKNNGLTVKSFELSIGASNGYVNSISKGIGKDKLDKIIEVYPNLDALWLITGEENKNLNKPLPNYESIEKKISQLKTLEDVSDFIIDYDTELDKIPNHQLWLKTKVQEGVIKVLSKDLN